MAKVGLCDNKCDHVEEFCRLHNKLKDIFYRKLGISWKIFICIFEDIPKASKTLTDMEKCITF